MPLIPRLVEKLQRHPKRFVFPEGADPRILQAARQIVTRRMGVPILLGERGVIKDTAARLDVTLAGMRLIDPAQSADLEDFAGLFAELRRAKGLSIAEARVVMQDVNYFATMMLATSQADALIGGATVTASSALRPLFQIVPLQENVRTASSLMILDFDEKKFGFDGSLFLADCGVIPEPTADQLADIAITTAQLAHHLTNGVPRVAMLSYASKGDTRNPTVLKMRTAAEIARTRSRLHPMPFEIEGELQVDAALDPRTAEVKHVGGAVAGRANVLIFPDLNSGNIGFKLVQFLAGANTFGQIITGLTRPAAEISRGASAHDIFGAAAIVGCQAISRLLLYGRETSTP
jgi:phosphate acetyltransferase